MLDFYIGQTFIETYPPEAAIWCNDNNAMIVHTDKGYEIQSLPVLTKYDLETIVRAERNNRLNEITWMLERHKEELELGVPTTLQVSESVNQYKELLEYRQALRDLPSKEGFPWNGDSSQVPWPIKPNFLSESTPSI